ncbi:hypothetical protein Scep_010390 [Stephania cephalantha]
MAAATPLPTPASVDEFIEPTLHSSSEVKLSDVATTLENGYLFVDDSSSEDDDQLFEEMPLRIDYGEFGDFDEDPDSDGVENGGVLILVFWMVELGRA